MAARIDEGGLTDNHLGALAAELGVSDRHLRRTFGDEFGVSPVAYAQTQRLLLAKRLLTDTGLPVTEVALAAGFGSVRRFNALFRQRYRLQPSQLRRLPTSRRNSARAFRRQSAVSADLLTYCRPAAGSLPHIVGNRSPAAVLAGARLRVA